ncbi:ABC transporter permease [Allofournierella massiliensis]|uniref:ABC-2 type transport system permease protein n=1 Tax=Allofournierella massiliensis TaxID=1650663 RepID=A0A4R1QQA0_9FIRM|nr:ABC transporter permease [Fournierella massiliensis]TCL55567.1 ABC-2 type transport system permease protein [Fournierella massiliensis]
MSAIFKREFKSYYSGMMGWLLTGVMLLFGGLYFTAANLQGGYTNFSIALYSFVIVLLIFIPLLCMRSFAEEKRSKTDQLLLTSPVSITGIVLGKYLALLAMFAVPVAIFSLYPLIMLMLGGVDLVASYAGILGYFFMGAACIAVCMYLSTLTENQIIAALSGFGVLLVSYLLPSIQTLFTTGSGLAMAAFVVILLAVSLIVGLRSRSLTLGAGVFVVGFVLLTILFNTRSAVLTSAFTSVLGALALFEPFLEFVNGLFSVTALVYYLGVIVLSLFLTGQALEKRRWN